MGARRTRLSPVPRSCLIQYARRLQRRDVDGPIRRSRADGRRLEGELDGSSSRGAAASATAGRQRWRWTHKRQTRSGAQGTSPSQPRTPRGSSQGRKVSKARSGDRKTAERGRRKATGKGAGNRPIEWLRSRRPRPVASSPASAGGAGSIGNSAMTRRSHQIESAPSRAVHRLDPVPAPRSANSISPARMISIPIWLNASGKSPNTERS
jgi:hypothetical protein